MRIVEWSGRPIAGAQPATNRAPSRMPQRSESFGPAAGTDEPLKVAAKMRSVPIEDFFSRNGKLREDGLMVHDLILVQVKKPEESKYPWDYYRILTHIPGDQAFGPPNPACPQVKG